MSHRQKVNIRGTVALWDGATVLELDVETTDRDGHWGMSTICLDVDEEVAVRLLTEVLWPELSESGETPDPDMVAEELAAYGAEHPRTPGVTYTDRS